jgi:hypothetical protein
LKIESSYTEGKAKTMARRFAGDIFSQPVEARGGSDRSVLVDYFPEFRDFTRTIGGSTSGEEAKRTGGLSGVAAFGGFKPLQKHETQAPKPFAGAKPSGYATR